MATVSWSVLAEGFVPDTTPADIFNAGADEVWVKLVTLFNDDAAQQAVVLYVLRSGGTTRKVARYVLDQNESASWDLEIALGPGDSIQAVTTTASAVHYTVSGGTKVP